MITTINEFRKYNENFNLDDRAKLEFVMSIATPEQREVLTNFQAGTEQFFLQLLKGTVTVQLIDDTLQLMVNDVEGDDSQLEPEHAAYAKSKGWLDAFNENVKTINEDESNPNYMVLGNISKMSRMLAEMSELLGTENLDEWAKDHIATSADDIEEVYNFLKSKNETVQLPGINSQPAICMEPIQEAATRDHYIIVVGDDVADNGNKESMDKKYESIPKGTRPSNYRSMYKLVKEDK